MNKGEDLKESEIKQVFKKLYIPEKELAEYKDPYSFASKIKKCSVLTINRASFSTGTGLVERGK